MFYLKALNASINDSTNYVFFGKLYDNGTIKEAAFAVYVNKINLTYLILVILEKGECIF